MIEASKAIQHTPDQCKRSLPYSRVDFRRAATKIVDISIDIKWARIGTSFDLDADHPPLQMGEVCQDYIWRYAEGLQEC